MAVNFTNLLGIDLPSTTPQFGNIFEQVLKGYTMAEEPGRLARAKEKENLANRLSQLEVEHKPTEYSLSDRLKQAQIEKASRPEELNLELNKLLNLRTSYPEGSYGRNTIEARIKKLTTDSQRQLQDKFMALWDQGHPNATPEQRQKAAQEQAERQIKQMETLNTSREKYANSLAWRNTPIDERKRIEAVAVGAGYSPSEAAERLTAGEDIKKMVEEKGMNLEDVEAKYPITTSNLSKAQNRNAMNQELNYLDKVVAEATAPYSKKMLKFSPQQIVDAMKKDKKSVDAQGKFLAARMIANELNGLRMAAQGGKVGIEAIKHLNNTSLNDSRIFDSLVTPEVYSKMQEYLQEWFSKGNDAYQSGLSNYSGYGGTSSGSSEKIYNLATGAWE